MLQIGILIFLLTEKFDFNIGNKFLYIFARFVLSISKFGMRISSAHMKRKSIFEIIYSTTSARNTHQINHFKLLSMSMSLIVCLRGCKRLRLYALIPKCYTNLTQCLYTICIVYTTHNKLECVSRVLYAYFYYLMDSSLD